MLEEMSSIGMCTNIPILSAIGPFQIAFIVKNQIYFLEKDKNDKFGHNTHGQAKLCVGKYGRKIPFSKT
jgi:hypothetical protein